MTLVMEGQQKFLYLKEKSVSFISDTRRKYNDEILALTYMYKVHICTLYQSCVTMSDFLFF